MRPAGSFACVAGDEVMTERVDVTGSALRAAAAAEPTSPPPTITTSKKSSAWLEYGRRRRFSFPDRQVALATRSVAVRKSRSCCYSLPAAQTQAERIELRATARGIELRDALRAAVKPIKNYGIFGVKAADLEVVKQAVEQLEAENPLSEPTARLELLAGGWDVIFSTIKVTGLRRIKLGLKDLVQIGQLSQEIDPHLKIATNRVGFKVPAFGVKNGELVLRAAYQVSSPTRVSITLEEATLTPERLQSIFEANFDLLLSIFNPAGFLDITYCDDQLRCGRDDKGNIFVLERSERANL